MCKDDVAAHLFAGTSFFLSGPSTGDRGEMFCEGTADASGRIQGKEQKRSIRHKEIVRQSSCWLISRKEYDHCYMCMCTHAYIYAEKGCRNRKQTTGTDTSGKKRGTDIIGIVIIRMHFIEVLLMSFLKIPPKWGKLSYLNFKDLF